MNKKNKILIGIAILMVPMLLLPSFSLASPISRFPNNAEGANEVPLNLRAWHINGQTFLVWEHPISGHPESGIYEIYEGLEPIYSLDNATLIGQVFYDNGENKRLQSYIPDTRWILPDGSEDGYRVDEEEAYFVNTPHEPRTAYYAVVPLNGNNLGSQNRVGPVIETIDPIKCHIQYQEANLTIYAHWIDGREDYTSGREGYPVMGNEHSNGLGFNFAVWNPTNKPPLENMPMVCWLHGLGGDFMSPSIVGDPASIIPDGLFVTFDDVVESTQNIFTSWIGYANEFDRFSPEGLPSNDAIVVDYTAQRIYWETNWIKDNFSIDPQRISLAGNSMGGNAVLLHTELSDIYAAAIAIVPRLNINPGPIWFPLFGTPTQRLRTTFPGQPLIWQVINATWRTEQPHPDWPYALIVSGTEDELAGWQSSSTAFIIFDTTQTGRTLYWDERTHTDWEGAYFENSEHLSPRYLTRFLKDKSFPAFSATDESPESGRQPDISNIDLYPWGTWGGYLEWDPQSIVDEPTRWEATIWITDESSCQCDIPLTENILADVTLRRLQTFNPEPARLYDYELIDLSSGEIIQSGTVQPAGDGTLTVKELLFSKDPYRLVIEKQSSFNYPPVKLGNQIVNEGEPIEFSTFTTDNDNGSTDSTSDMLETKPQIQIHTFKPDISVLEYFCKNKNEAPIIKEYVIDPSPPRENTLHTITVNANDPEEGLDITVLFDATTGKIIQDTRDRFRAYWWIPEEAPNYAELVITVVDTCGFSTTVFILIDIQNND